MGFQTTIFIFPKCNYSNLMIYQHKSHKQGAQQRESQQLNFPKLKKL